MEAYIASDNTKWNLVDCHRNGMSLWESDGHWAAVCDEHELPTDAEVCQLPKEMAYRIFCSLRP
jgi:hypothetical protein